MGGTACRRGVIAALIGMRAVEGDEALAACNANEGDPCRKTADCCTGVCVTPAKPARKRRRPAPSGRCRCVKAGAECAGTSECCGALVCASKVCAVPSGGGGKRCSASSCGDGCCAGTQCIRAARQSAAQCGRNGERCIACPAGKVCAGGTCADDGCNADSCPQGCCGPQGCVPYAEQDNTTCGAGGAACAGCGDRCCDVTVGVCLICL